MFTYSHFFLPAKLHIDWIRRRAQITFELKLSRDDNLEIPPRLNSYSITFNRQIVHFIYDVWLVSNKYGYKYKHDLNVYGCNHAQILK